MRAFYNKAKTMPPPNPGSLPDDTYADIVAYVLDINGFESGGAEFLVDSEALD